MFFSFELIWIWFEARERLTRPSLTLTQSKETQPSSPPFLGRISLILTFGWDRWRTNSLTLSTNTRKSRGTWIEWLTMSLRMRPTWSDWRIDWIYQKPWEQSQHKTLGIVPTKLILGNWVLQKSWEKYQTKSYLGIDFFRNLGNSPSPPDIWESHFGRTLGIGNCPLDLGNP